VRSAGVGCDGDPGGGAAGYCYRGDRGAGLGGRRLHRFSAGPKGTAVIAGTPAASAKGKAYAITLTARDGAGHAVSQRFTLTVS
jgi:hypothetical protein